MQINIENIKKSYGSKKILNGITFSASSGQCIGILGSNGCGKSTLMSILAGIHKCKSGRFLIDGKNLFSDIKTGIKNIGYVPQSTPLIEELTARDNLKLWYDSSRLKAELINGIPAILGIHEFLKTPVYKMSGGMKKRLAIACAVAHHPMILLLDEPSAALDLVCKENIYNYLSEFKKHGGIIIISTHDIQDFPLCDKLYVMKDGVLHPYDYDGNVHKLAGYL